MTNKNIQDAVDEKVDIAFANLVFAGLSIEQVDKIPKWLLENMEKNKKDFKITLTQLVKEVEVGERDAFEEGRMFAYNEALDACNVNETSEQVADDIRQKIRRPDIYETKRTPPTSDVKET